MRAQPLRLLVLEDHATDADLMVDALRQGGFAPTWERVETEAEFFEKLEAPLDVILADYSLPGFDARRALELLQALGLDVPFIIVTGSVSEEAAVDCMKRGATDYLLKDRLNRLSEAVRHALTERELRAERRRADEGVGQLAAIVLSSLDAIFALSPEGFITSWNPGAERLYGYRAEEVIGRSDDLILPADHRDEGRDRRSRLARGESVAMFETVRLAKDGERIDVSVTSSPIQDASANVVGISAIHRDVRDRKLAEAVQRESGEQLRQAQKMEAIGRLAGGIAHDFNNMLGLVLGYGEFLARAVENDSTLSEYVGEIRDAAERAARLTQQLLAFSRRQMLEPRVLDLNGVVFETEKMLRRLIGDDIELVTSLSETGARIKADPGLLEQVLMNLAVNGRDAMPDGGTLTITTDEARLDERSARRIGLMPGQYVSLSVSDTGSGMDKVTLDRIFEPFFTTKEAGKGTGLGLATVFGIVTQSGGGIGVESAVGIGSRFTIYLPVTTEPETVTWAAGSSRALGGAETILLIEDEPGLRVLGKRVLDGEGYRVVEAPNGAEALRLSREQADPIDLLVTDVVMPGMSGPELAGLLNAERPGLPVLYMSGYMDEDVIRRGVEEGTASLIRKPFAPTELLRRVRERLDAPTLGAP